MLTPQISWIFLRYIVNYQCFHLIKKNPVLDYLNIQDTRLLFPSKKLGPSHQNLFSQNFSYLFKRVKISARLYSVLQCYQSLKLLFLKISCTLFSTKVWNSFLFEEVHTSVTWESLQKYFFEICKTLGRAFSALTISLLKSRFPRNSNLGIVGGFIGISLDLSATKLTDIFSPNQKRILRKYMLRNFEN